MPVPPRPTTDDPPEVLLEKGRLLYDLALEKQAVIDGIKAHLAPWKSDKRMKVMGEILLGTIERIEKEERERTAEGTRNRTV